MNSASADSTKDYLTIFEVHREGYEMSKIHRIAQFHEVSLKQWNIDGHDIGSYAAIKLPERATMGSAGYDFFAPYEFTVEPKQSLVVHSGVRAEIAEGWMLLLFVRSSMGIKYGIQLANGTGIIDADFFFADNEGHIMLKFVNTGDKPWHVNEGDRICQGIFTEFGITTDDDAKTKRVGGVGSTGK